jgi:hypothetical protein
LLVLIFAFISVSAVEAAHYKVILLGGQSNMTGNGPKLSDLTAAQQAPQEDVWIYGGGSLKQGALQPGFGSPYGPEISFGRTIADGRPHENFALIKFSQGGTHLYGDWDPNTGSVYNKFKTTVDFGLEALTRSGHTYEIVGMLWTQGERDAAHLRTTAEYEADLNEFIADIRSRYGANVSFFISRLSILQTGREPGLHDIRAAQENVAAADSNAYLIDTDTFQIAGDNIHFTGTGLVSLGNAFGQSYLNSLPVDSSTPQIDTLTPANTASAVEPTTNLSIAFDEKVVFGTGNITLRQTGGAAVETYDVSIPSSGLSLSGDTLTIDPTSLLAGSTGYYIEIDATALQDHTGNHFAGISGDGTWAFTTSAGDVSAPGATVLSPTNGAGSVKYNQDLTITFSENIVFGTGAITLRLASDGTLVESYDVASPPANLSISGGILTINPTADLLPSTGYYVEIDATAIDDAAGNSFAGISGSEVWAFTSAAPLINGSQITATVSRTAFDGATPDKTIDGSGLSSGEHGTASGTYCLAPTDIYNPVDYQWLQWDLGASYTLGSIHVWNYNLRSVDVYYSNTAIPGAVDSGNWTRLGGASVELPAAGSPNTGFDLATATSTTLPATEVRFIRFEANSTWGGSGVGISEIQFSAGPAPEDETPPGIDSLSPADTSSDIGVSSNLTITFTENVTFGTGNITLRQSGGALVESFDVSGPAEGLSLNGATVTIDPTSNLSASTTYYVEIDDTAIDDIAGNSFAGFSGSGTWTFSTVAPDVTAPTLSNLSPANGATGVGTGVNLSITFSENIAFGAGNITLRQSGGALIESFDVSGLAAGLSLNGATVTIDPTSDLATSTTYYVEIDATAVDDLAGNSFAGISGSGTWSFTAQNEPTGAGTLFTDSIAVQSNGYNPDPVGAVGLNWNGSYPIRTIVAFSVADIANNESLAVGDFATAEFNLSFTTVNGIMLTAGESYVVEYLGFYEGITLNESFFDGRYGTAATSTVDTGIEDTSATGQDITASSFILSGVTAADPDDYVVFRISYIQATVDTIQQLDDFTLTALTTQETFSTWIGGFNGVGGLTAPGDDPDGDGDTNAEENFFGTHPGERSASLQAVAVDTSGTTTFNFTHPINENPASDLSATYIWSKDLATFYTDGNPDPAGTTVSFVQGTPANGMVTVTATVSGTAADRMFVDVEVTQQ